MMSLLWREAACTSSCSLEMGFRVLVLKVETWNGFPLLTKRGEFSTCVLWSFTLSGVAESAESDEGLAAPAAVRDRVASLLAVLSGPTLLVLRRFKVVSSSSVTVMAAGVAK